MRRACLFASTLLFLGLSAAPAQANWQRFLRHMGCGFGEGYHARAHLYCQQPYELTPPVYPQQPPVAPLPAPAAKSVRPHAAR